jgi:hypothetical protein
MLVYRAVGLGLIIVPLVAPNIPSLSLLSIVKWISNAFGLSSSMLPQIAGPVSSYTFLTLGLIALWHASRLKRPKVGIRQRRQQSTSLRLRGYFLRLCALATFPTGAWGLWVAYGRLKSQGYIDLFDGYFRNPLIGVPGSLLMYLCYLLLFALLFFITYSIWSAGNKNLYQAKRLVDPSVKEERGRDNRRPVLFLRSFVEDRVDSRSMWMGNAPTVEAGITPTARRYGPFIAIAEPGQLTPGGAARESFAGESWRAAVQSWSDEALFVVLLAGKTQGVRWEIIEMLRRTHLSKFVVLLPRVRAEELLTEEEKRALDLKAKGKVALERYHGEQRSVWQHLCQSFEGTVWHLSLVNVSHVSPLATCFRPEGDIILFYSKYNADEDYQTSLDLSVYAMFCFEQEMGSQG